MKKASKILLIIILLILIAICSAGVFVIQQAKPVSKECTNQVRVEIPYGMSVMNVSNLLEKEGLIRNAKLFYYCARYPQITKILFPNENNAVFSLKSGIYTIDNNLNIVQIQKILSSGQQEYIKVSIPEGLTITKIAKILDENRICSADDFIAKCKSISMAEKYNIPGESVEGFLFPDTYFLTVGMTAESIIDLMVNNFYEKIKTVPNLSEKNAADLYETVKLASIVEREYRVKDEAPLIASVFKNRLRRNIGLYSCATVEYILTEIEGREHPERILIEDTKIDNPYNTYVWAGLPPGPISNPGLVSLDASTNTPRTKYYFFQIVDADEGRHVFSESFEEHKINHNLSVKK